VWLQTKGLDARAIGVVLAIPMVVRVVAVPIGSRLADRMGALRAALIGLSAAATGGYVLVAWAEGLPALVLAVALASAAFTPIGPITDAYAVRGLMARGRAYGPIRLWGSVAFIVANLGTGSLVGRIDPSHYIWLMVAALLALTLASFALRPMV